MTVIWSTHLSKLTGISAENHGKKPFSGVMYLNISPLFLCKLFYDLISDEEKRLISLV